MAIHLENFVSIRKLYPRVSERVPSTRLAVSDPATETERDYRNLLSEANLNFFHREYSIALQNYLNLRQKILEQSHPEMPRVPGIGTLFEFEWRKVDPERIFELSRRTVLKTPPGTPVTFPLTYEALIKPNELPVNEAFSLWSTVGVDIRRLRVKGDGQQRADARDAILGGDWKKASKLYNTAAQSAVDADDFEEAAQLANEEAAMLATYAPDDALDMAMSRFTKAEQWFTRSGNLEALEVVRANRANLMAETSASNAARDTPPFLQANPGAMVSDRLICLADGGQMPVRELLQPQAKPARDEPAAHGALPRRSRAQMVLDQDGWRSSANLAGLNAGAAAVPARSMGLFTPLGSRMVSLDSTAFAANLSETIYKSRIEAVDLEGISFYEVVDVNFVAYFVHLYYFVLPISIGDTYMAMGLYQKALAEYRSVLAYPFLNMGIEAPYVWLKMANAYLNWGNTLYRRDQRAAARQKYEFIVKSNLSVPASELYQGRLAALQGQATETLKEIRNEAHGTVNPAVAAVIIQASMRLQYLAQGFNFFGIGVDYAPVFRFKYLQSVATYMADSAIEAERTFIGYRSTAENQKIERMQLESAVDVNKAAVAVEQHRLDDASLEIEAAQRTREYAETRKQNADDALTEWDTKGRELTSMNSALTWASNAANDQEVNVYGTQYDGGSHDYHGTVENFYEIVGQKRDWLDYEMQRNRIVRQQAEMAAEVAMAKTREEQATVRYEVQQLTVLLAEKRLEGSQEVLDYAENRLFDEDLWFQLANQLQDLARSYLDSAIYAALVMERAYDIEFDRRLNRIRTDYMLAAPAGLLGGDNLKRDIVSFTSDYLEHAQKKNPVRLAVSLREEFPSGFAAFVDTGILPFRTDLEIFDRRYPGTFRRKIKKVEVFVEGLVPLEGASGFLCNNGISSEWRKTGGAWGKFNRVMPVERAVLSSYQFRRDISVFQPSEEMLGQFENMGPQCEWSLELPRSGNNLDYQAISDVKFVVYFDADYDDSLAAYVKAYYPATGARSTVLSSRFQYPDEYFRLDAERSVDFTTGASQFPCNIEGLALTAFGVRLLPATGESVANLGLVISRESDGSSINAVTDASGVIKSAVATMAPFGAWLGVSPLDTWRVALADGINSAAVADIQLFITYSFNYRADT